MLEPAPGLGLAQAMAAVGPAAPVHPQALGSVACEGEAAAGQAVHR